jgi:hypothetical protein
LKAGSGGWRIDNLSLTQVGEDNKVIGAAQLMDDDGKPRESNPVVITFRDGKIRDMQGFTSRHEAERFAHRR